MDDVGGAARWVYEVLSRLLACGEHPSEREIAAAARLAASTANTHLKTLRAAGWVDWTDGKARSFKITRGSNAIPDPFELTVFAVAAGPPSPTSDIDAAIMLTRRRLRDGEIFTIRARGDSMINAAILDGDTLVARRQRHADHGDLVIATVPDETGLGRHATVKQFDTSHGRPRLLAANPRYAAIESDDIAIIGKVFRVERRIADSQGRRRGTHQELG